MKSIGIDLETYSDVDLGKSGVYKYAESSQFDILLFGYSIDDKDVKVVDLACGEEIPDDILEALTNPDIIKWSFNCAFERICLSVWLKRNKPRYFKGINYLNPQGWRCTMVWSSYLGLPLSLKGVGAVLKLDSQKMDEGKGLIRYFCMPCKPTKTNGGRIRNLPSDAPDKWALFKKYNRRDVEVEEAIKHKLRHFPVPESVWEEYVIDQEINDRGARIDRKLVDNAIKINELCHDANIKRMEEITGLENPNSVMQMLKWLKSKGYDSDSLDKKHVAKLLKTADGDVKEILLLRQQTAKSSVKKYTAMENAMCDDDRIRGMFQFYGASRTGRFSGRIVQLQNLRRNSISDLKEARELVRRGDYETLTLLYDSVPDILSQLIRTAIIPCEGYKFIVADYSSVEARALAYLADEKHTMDAFARGEDIYCATASAMFGVPVVKHGINGELRQKGKIATLACIAEGQLVLTDHGEKPIEKVEITDKVWDGEHFVSHEGIIYKGEREVITYDGLTATPDHLVFVEGKEDPIPFGIAAKSSAHLIQTGDGRSAIRMGKNNQPRKKMERKLESLLCTNKMSELWDNPLDSLRKPKKWKVKRMPEMFAEKANSFMARSKINSGKATLYKSPRSTIQKLWCARNKVLFPISYNSWAVSYSTIWITKQKPGNRQDRQYGKLCAGQYTICNKKAESGKQKKYCLKRVRSTLLALRTKCCHSKIKKWNDTTSHHRRCNKGRQGKKKMLASHKCTARLYDIRNAGPHHRFTVSGKLVHNCGYGGAVGALKAMGALDMGLKEEDLQPIVDAWRKANPHIVQFWWDVDRAAKDCIIYKTTVKLGRLTFRYEKGMMLIDLPSGRHLSYPKPRIGINKFGGDSITYMGTDNTKHWSRIESYGPKIVENITQAICRDILCFAMRTLRDYHIVAHIHDELIIECPKDTSLDAICEMMGRTPPWLPGLLLRADGYECDFYMKA